MLKTPREIVNATFNYLIEVTPATQKISDVRIEEIQPFKEDAKDFWKVVLSFDNVGELPFDRKREYKEFKVQDDPIHVIKMTSVNAK
jgi:uncharacterized protein with ATP-grasp and redox domains